MRERKRERERERETGINERVDVRTVLFNRLAEVDNFHDEHRPPSPEQVGDDDDGDEEEDQDEDQHPEHPRPPVTGALHTLLLGDT